MATDLSSAPESNLPAAAPANLAKPAEASTEQSFSTLVNGIITDVKHLVEQQLALFRQEIRDDIRKGKAAVLSLAVGVGLSAMGVFMLLLLLPLLLNWAVPGLPLWSCFGIVGGVLTALGGGLVYAGARKIESFNPMSSQAVDALKENLNWTSKPT